MLNTRQQERLQARVEAIIIAKRHAQFTAAEVAAVLHVDKYDVLQTLHGMAADRKVDHLSSGNVFADRWQLTPYAIYLHSPIHAQPVAEAL